jgi:ubiquinone/menaquinone biosynthesis C-methylase UbiE
MDKIRKLHNNCKRQLIQEWVKPGSCVLDCGCGRGGDWWKWKEARVQINAIDPDPESLIEAEKRAKEIGLDVVFLGAGDIRQAAFAGPYDVVCYNFSIHYIMADLENSIRAIKIAVRPGGLLMGIAPEKARAEVMADENGVFSDDLHNKFKIDEPNLLIQLSDGPYYADGPKVEPLLDSRILIQNLKEAGFEKIIWEPMLPRPNGMISDIYSKFVFRANIS